MGKQYEDNAQEIFNLICDYLMDEYNLNPVIIVTVRKNTVFINFHEKFLNSEIEFYRNGKTAIYNLNPHDERAKKAIFGILEIDNLILPLAWKNTTHG
ncbi:MAG: hypothetical protein LBP40_04760 [Campylobacteraceae bacterium]|jgi:hypothetical protein|nr:hypothetical protein [Campylobacteraceae bacterium]